jgi:nucleotide-binding universal stress UspA family protein
MTARDNRSRVYVGVDGSLTSLRALREAAVAARRRRAELHVVHVRPRERPIPLPPVAEFGSVIQSWEPEPSDRLDRAAMELILGCLRDALGGAPADLDVHLTVLTGDPHRELVSIGCRDEDLLVVGTGGGRRWSHMRRRSVSRYCAGHARCPVLVVPRDEFARTMRRRIWAHPAASRDPWRDFDAVRGRKTHPIR